MVFKKLLLKLLFLIPFFAYSQFNLGENAEIHLVTIGPGTALYDSFGHTGIRVKDPENNRDLIFNYGVYDFQTPNFYLKFARGKLPYLLAVASYEKFKDAYIAEDRWITEQVLNLNKDQKATVFNFLLNNAQPENREYQYDFFYDNCATKPRDVIAQSLGENVNYPSDYAPIQYSFRQLIQQRLHWNSWGSLGIDVALGAVIDVVATPWEHQFLPSYVMDAAAQATVINNGNEQPLVATTINTYETSVKEKTVHFLTSPFFIFLILATLIIVITLKDIKSKIRSRWLDGTLFLITGLIGLGLTFLWWGTDHTATANNYNLLWAFPLNFFFFILISSKQPKRWLSNYVFFLTMLLVLLCIHWITGVQGFALSLTPLLTALIFRYIYLFYYFKKYKLQKTAPSW